MRLAEIVRLRNLLLAISVLAVALVSIEWDYPLEMLKNLLSDALARSEGFYVKAKNYSKNEKSLPALHYDDGIVGTTNSLLAFTDAIAYSPEEEIVIYVRSLTESQITVIDPSSDSKMLSKIPVVSLKKPAPVTFYRKSQGFDLNGFAKHAIATIDMSPGWFNIRVSSKDEAIDLPVLIRDVKNREILFVESTDTLKAYFSYGDLPTFYSEARKGRTFHWRPSRYPIDYSIKFDKRKFRCLDHLINADHFLKEMISTVFGEFDVVEDNYLDSFEKIADYKLIIFGAHNEYWSSEKFDNIMKFFGRGGNLLVLGGNVAWRYSLRVEGGDIIGGGGEYLPSHKSIQELLGNRFSRVGYKTFAGFRVVARDHFLMVGVPTEFGNASSFAHCGQFAASGLETDKLASSRFSHLAQGKNGKGKGADIVFLDRTEFSGSVLNFGSVSLVHAYEDTGLVRILSNYANYLNLRFRPT